MTATRAFARGAVLTAAGLLLAACTLAPAAPSPSPQPLAPGVVTTEAVGPPPAPLYGTTWIDPSSAAFSPVSDGDGATTLLVTSFDYGGDILAAEHLTADGRLLLIRIPAGHVDNDVVVKPSQYEWSDGAVSPLGSTADLVPGDPPRQSFATWTDGSTTVWVESPSIQAGPYPWRIFAATGANGPVLVGKSEDIGPQPDYPSTPAPVAFDDRVYWATNLPSGSQIPTGVWSAPVTGGEATLVLAGASDPIATDVGVFATTTQWGPDGRPADGSLELRVVRIDGPHPDTTLRTLDVGKLGSVGPLFGGGRWLAAAYTDSGRDGSGYTDGFVVFNGRLGDGYSIFPVANDRPNVAVVCDAALVWIEPDEDFLADTMYRADLASGSVLAISVEDAFALGDCSGNSILWSQLVDGGVRQYVTTVD